MGRLLHDAAQCNGRLFNVDRKQIKCIIRKFDVIIFASEKWKQILPILDQAWTPLSIHVPSNTQYLIKMLYVCYITATMWV